MFDNYNGRYAGNLVELAITRSTFFRVFLYALVNTLIVFFMSKILNLRTSYGVVLLLALIVIIPRNIYRQTFGWFAGFSNYNTALLVTLIAIYLLFFAKKNSYTPIAYIGLGALFFIGQLFVEHMTIYNMLLSIFALIVNFFFYKRKKFLSLLYFISNILGLITLFSNSAYMSIVQSNDSYRSVGADSEGLLTRVIKTLTMNWTDFLVVDNYFLNAILTIVLIIVVYNYFTKNNKKDRLSSWLLAYVTLFTGWTIFKGVYNIEANFFGKYFLLLQTIGSIFYLVVIAILIWRCIPVLYKRMELIFWGTSAVITVLPFLVLSPIGPRCFLSAYFFMCILTVRLLQTLEFNENMLGKFYKKLSWILIATFVISGGMMYTLVSYKNMRVSQTRVESRIKNSNSSIIIRLPFEEFTQQGSPNKGSIQEKTFKQYYGIPVEESIRFQNNIPKPY